MQANPSKFQTISVGKETFDKKPVYKFGEAGMICEETVKLLDIDFKFNFDKHSAGKPRNKCFVKVIGIFV